MRSLFIDVAGLVLFNEKHRLGIFVDGTAPRISTGRKAIPPHHSFIAIRTEQHDTVSPPRPATFVFDHDPREVLAGSAGLNAVYVLTRVNDPSDPKKDVFDRITIEGAQPPDSTGTLDGILDVREVMPDQEIPAATIQGTSRAVAVLLDTRNAEIQPISDSNHDLQFGSSHGSFAHTVRLIYHVPDDVTPAVVVTNSGGVVDRFKLTAPEELENGDEGWHLFAGDVPLHELFNLGIPHEDLHHFELIYDLYGFDDRAPRPIPVHDDRGHGHGPRLSRPGFCGPPASG